MAMYRVDLQVWPYSGVKREPAAYQSAQERAMRGVEQPSIVIEANGFCEARKIADFIRLGVQLDERVWRVNILGVSQIKEATRPTELMTECAYA